MPAGTAAVLTGAGALASAFGGSKKQTTSENLSGYQALPKEVQDLLIQQYLPKAQATLNMPYQNIPMQRYEGNPQSDPFASQGLADLQKFSDAAGGYFTPYNPNEMANKVSMASYQGAAGSGSAQPMQTPMPNGSFQSDEMLVNQYLAGLPQGGGRAGDVGASLNRFITGGVIKPKDLAAALKSGGYKAGSPSDPNIGYSLMKGGF